VEPVKLKQLLRGIPNLVVRGSKEIEISGVSADSRTIVPGHVFIAKKGGTFIGQALEAGAAAIVTDLYDPSVSQTQIICAGVEKMEACLAARFFRRASEELFVVGVTGTKGKTTTTYLIRHLLEGLQEPTGLMGTVETIIRDVRYPARLTTLDATMNQKRLREMVDQGCKAAVLEVSSHGLDQGRVDEIAFDIALFTNLYPDHLDYHKTMEEYAAAKAKLFEKLKGVAIVNADSPWAHWMKGGHKRVSFARGG
jgi:UDP-N-acetylmuramoyl-L-alanyl-D-glutamate--2,6-diaminopimelate ligase